ncbi:hypothetical protein ACFPIJ_35070 [Dactylosporangium cerinum]|uniref:Uncharacterized protein n=1 Tax=Dactylosporangium cerinum TaxID=1434730 RepID=A0ABV9W656_9ACTN
MTSIIAGSNVRNTAPTQMIKEDQMDDRKDGASTGGAYGRWFRIHRAATQWGPPAATEDPRPETAEPLKRPDREHLGPRDDSATECGDVTALLSARPRSDGAVPAEGKPATGADMLTVDGPVGAGRSTTRPTVGE